jgi:hypothetical protein
VERYTRSSVPYCKKAGDPRISTKPSILIPIKRPNMQRETSGLRWLRKKEWNYETRFPSHRGLPLCFTYRARRGRLSSAVFVQHYSSLNILGPTMTLSLKPSNRTCMLLSFRINLKMRESFWSPSGKHILLVRKGNEHANHRYLVVEWLILTFYRMLPERIFMPFPNVLVLA